ncbi:methyl jasmonate esterase 1-like isoform X2 [Capsicum chacoense]|uniref:methyl jasmonate esterase 1-like isoform X2 n=1 Tax=Capsicum annuum TaxID=4072 RepID=UPI001FB0728B|nr:methyl jasmonate esterase 1-like isoform X2 [Capsicum annuum]
MEKSKLLTSLVVLILLLPYVNATLSGPKAKEQFVLVHRACHGAWSWYKIVALMQSSGHNVTAIDLGASGNNPKQVLEVRHLSDYFSPLMKFMASLPAHEKVVLVGHEIGGFGISKAIETFPEKILVAVFVTALMPGPTLNASTVYTKAIEFTGVLAALDNHVTFDDGPKNPPTTFSYGPKYLATNIYQLSSDHCFLLLGVRISTKLVRPVFIFRAEDVSKEIVVSSKRFGSVKRAFIVAAEDKLIKKEFQKWMIEKNRPDEVEVIQGSDHMTMMSKPLQLFPNLLSIANKYS